MAATKGNSYRNSILSRATQHLDKLTVRTSGGASDLLAWDVTWGIPASGSSAVASTPVSGTASATGTAAEARLGHTNGTGSGYLVNGSPSVGDVSIPVDTGTGTLLVGDIITFNGDTQEYMITKDYAGGAGNIDISPGLVAAPADNAAITLETAPEITGLLVDTATGASAWSTSTSYTTGDKVTNNSKHYIATEDHTAGADDEPGVGPSWTDMWDRIHVVLNDVSITSGVAYNLTSFSLEELASIP